jgi:hypothetical protein
MEKNNKSRIPQLTDSKLKLPASFDQKKTDQAALNIKGSIEQQVSSRSKLKPPSTFSREKSSSDQQTFKTASKVVHESKGQGKKQTVTSTVTKTPNYIRRKWAPASSFRRHQNTNRTVKENVKATLEARRATPATKHAVRNTMTVQENTKRFIKKPASILGRIRDEDDGQQKKLMISAPDVKRKNKDAPVGRNVRKREALGTYGFNDLYGQNANLKADLSTAQITKAVVIADRTSLEVEKERLKKEHNIQFGEVCQLEHVLACEQSKVANLLDKIAKQRSDYLLMTQEKDNLLRNREELEERNNKADKELDELARVLAISDTELKEVTTQLDKKLHVNANLKSSVDQLRARLDNSQLNASASFLY